MARQYRRTALRQVANALIVPLVKLGLAPRRTHLLSVRGRRSNRVYTTPVNLVQRDGAEYLVAPYGEVAWVKNARAAGEVSLRRGRRSAVRRIEEMPPEKMALVLADYWRQNLITRPYFEARPDGGPGFERVAARHPVFRLL